MKSSAWLVRVTGVLAVLAIGAASGGDPAGPKRPKLFVAERTVDLGRLHEGDKATATFIIENRGDADLRIDSVTATCGCTIPQRLTEAERRVEPGEKLELAALFDSKGRVGSQRKNVQVLSNDSDEPTLQLTLSADVVALMELLVGGTANRALALGAVPPGSAVGEPIDVLPTQPGATLEIELVSTGDDALVHAVEPLKVDTRVGSRVQLQVDSEALFGHRVNTQVEIAAKIGTERTVGSIRVTGEVVGEFEFRPIEIRQPGPVLPGASLQPLVITSRGNQPFKILGVSCGPHLDAKVNFEAGKTKCTVTPVVKEGAPIGPLGAFFDVRLDNVVQPLIRIPLYAHVRPPIDVQPPTVVLHAGKDARTNLRIVKLESSAGETLEISDVRCEGGYATAEIFEGTGRPVRTLKYLRIQAAAEAPAGTHECVVRAKTNVTSSPEIVVPVTVLAP